MDDEQNPTTPDVETEGNSTPSDEQAVAAEAPPEASVAEEDDEEDTLDPEALRKEVRHLRDRARDAGLTPLRRMIRAYIENTIDAADSLLGALEGSNRKKGK